jgi:hypothetical protein
MVTLPTFPVTGGCQCGAVRYTLKAPPIVFYLCHCTECQKQSASAFGESVTAHPDDVEVTGELACYERPGAKGTVRCEFCPKCGTRMFHGRPERCNIKGGTLDDRSWLAPAGHIWTSSKQPYPLIGADELSYTHQPESKDALEKRWREMTGLNG